MNKEKMAAVRNKRKEVQYSEKEFAIVKEKAAKAGLNMAEYIRQASLNAKLTEALSIKDQERIGRANSIPYKMQVNLNQIARLGNIHGKDFISEAVLVFIRKFDAYVNSGEYETMDLDAYEAEAKRCFDKLEKMEEVEADLEAAYDELTKCRKEARNWYWFTREGEDVFKRKHNCTLFPDKDGFRWFFKVGNYMAYELPSQVIQDYHSRKRSISDLYDYWERYSY